MHLARNKELLERKFPYIKINTDDRIRNEEISFSAVTSKNGMPNLLFRYQEETNYVHSVYDPFREAGVILSKSNAEIEKAEHVIFFGCGLGYQIGIFRSMYPQKTFSVIEPFAEVWMESMTVVDHGNWLDCGQLKYLHLGMNFQAFFNQFITDVQHSIAIVPLPAYESKAAGVYGQFIQLMKTQIRHRLSTFYVNRNFERFWIYNAQLNFQEVITSPNVFDSIGERLKDKPVMIISAGPSLNYEMERIREIKAKNLAYLFAVGSANKALIHHGIMPDAIFSYDPSVRNQLVFEDLIHLGIDNIPLIFGSSIGFESLAKYPGEKFHFLTNRDAISGYMLEDQSYFQKSEIVNDAPTIAILTLDILIRLGCSPIILAGQNFGYTDGLIYANGIAHSDTKEGNKLTEVVQKRIVMTEGTDVDFVQTTEGWNIHRLAMENFLKSRPNVQVINTTTKGAKIQGTEFCRLEELMETVLNQTLPPFELQPKYRELDRERLQVQAEHADRERRAFMESLQVLFKMIDRLDQVIHLREGQMKISKAMMKVRDAFQPILGNRFFEHFLKPQLANQISALELMFHQLRNQAPSADFPVQFLKSFIVFGTKTKEVLEDNHPFFEKMMEPFHVAAKTE